jgi:hypothetical protein
VNYKTDVLALEECIKLEIVFGFETQNGIELHTLKYTHNFNKNDLQCGGLDFTVQSVDRDVQKCGNNTV